MLKVFIQNPWKSSDSPYYKSLKESPPKGVAYSNINSSNLIQKKRSMKINDFLKRIIKKIIRKLYPSMPNAHYTKNSKQYNLIHCAHCISKNKIPWITNMEYVGQFWASGGPAKKSQRNKILEILKKSNCKKIVAWTEWVKKEIIKFFPEIKDKVEVVYPGIQRQKFSKIKSKKIRLLFLSRKFYFKGGLYALKTMDLLTKKYSNVEATIVSDVPEEIIKKYSKNKKIKFFKMMPQKEVFRKIYPSADIFVYPSFTDTLGFPILEAMSFGIPVVGVEGTSRRELIENGVSGIVVNSHFKEFEPQLLENIKKEILKDLISSTEKLIENDKMRNNMSKECLRLFKPLGKFSIEKRNKELKRIYSEALKNE